MPHSAGVKEIIKLLHSHALDISEELTVDEVDEISVADLEQVEIVNVGMQHGSEAQQVLYHNVDVHLLANAQSLLTVSLL
jgi:hypothetical protein